MAGKSLNIGFVSFRFAGTDSVSLETAKWAKVLEGMGHTCFYFAGECDRPADRSMVVGEANSRHAETRHHHDAFWRSSERTHGETLWVKRQTDVFHRELVDFTKRYEIDLLIPQNVLSCPLNIPLTMAVTELIAETSFPTIAHHHDFFWQGKVFLNNSVWDYLTMAFPPTLHSIQHVVLNRSARHQLATRKGLTATLVPKVMDFEAPAPEPDEFSWDIRKALGLDHDEKLILQPTEVVPRKGIEHAIEFVSRLDMKARLIISHASNADDRGYVGRVHRYADLLGVNAIFAEELFGEERRFKEDGGKVYRLWDVFPHADLITYPSLYEGFGNAFLEAVWFRKPVVVNNYTIYETDIRTKGFRVIFFDDFITENTVAQARAVLEAPDYARKDCEHNYEIAQRYFSYGTLRTKLGDLLTEIFGVDTVHIGPRSKVA